MQPKILIFDLETSPNTSYTWGKYEQDVIRFKEERKIICFAWKWFGDKTVHTASIPQYYGYKNGIKKNLKLIEKLHSLISAANILVAQNGDNFDIKMANAEFVQYGMSPTPPHKSVDTLKIAKSKFRFNSNKLDDIGARLGLGRKMKTGGVDLWFDCMAGKPAAWKTMLDYNKQDVVLLEKIYVKLRPWMTGHPNMNVFDLNPGCPVCRGTRNIKSGIHMTMMGRRQRYHCKDCGKWSLGPATTGGLLLRP